MKKYLMIILRFLLEILLSIILYPFIIVIEIIWLFRCIKEARLLNCGISEGIIVWCRYLIACLNMNKDFIINGL